MMVPRIIKCVFESCSYNSDSRCRASAITVGDEDHPRCDTFFQSNAKGGESLMGRVGACKVTVCMFNKLLECDAREINIGLHGPHPDCLTFVRMLDTNDMRKKQPA